MKRAGFTLIEMMVAIAIFALIVIFLYKSYNTLRVSNQKYTKISQEMERLWHIKKMLYLDFALVIDNVRILHQQRNEDVVLLQTSNSIHNRINPYVAYVVKEGTLYRIESLQKLTYPFGADTTGDVDAITPIKRFRVYKALKKEYGAVVTYYLLDIVRENGEKILYKIRRLNQS